MVEELILVGVSDNLGRGPGIAVDNEQVSFLASLHAGDQIAVFELQVLLQLILDVVLCVLLGHPLDGDKERAVGHLCDCDGGRRSCFRASGSLQRGFLR